MHFVLSKIKDGTRIILVAPIETNNNFWEKISKDEQAAQKIKLFLLGDIYGPGEPYVDIAKNQPAHVNTITISNEKLWSSGSVADKYYIPVTRRPAGCRVNAFVIGDPAHYFTGWGQEVQFRIPILAQDDGHGFTIGRKSGHGIQSLEPGQHFAPATILIDDIQIRIAVFI